MKIKSQLKYAIGFSLFGLMLLFLVFNPGKPPLRSELTKVEGEIDWVKSTGRSGGSYRFKLKGESIIILYPNCGVSCSKVYKALSSKSALISLLYYANDSSTNNVVYELVKNGAIITSYEYILEHRSNSNELIGFIGLLSLVIAGLLFVTDFKRSN